MTKRKLNNKIKKIRVGAKRKWFLHYRPMAQKLFFPILGIILLIGILNYERVERGTILIENATAAFDSSASPWTAETEPESPEANGLAVQTPISVVSETKGDTKIIQPMNPETIEVKIRNAFKGEEELAVAVAKCESQLDPSRIGDTHMKKWSYGLFQVNQTWHPYSKETLLNPDENIRIAKEIREKGGWQRWSCYSQNYYQKYL